MADVTEEYGSSMSGPYFSSVLNINKVTTQIANMNIKHAPFIVKKIVEDFYSCSQKMKLNGLDLMDSIMKNIGKIYIELFNKHLIALFTSIFETKVDENDRSNLYKMRTTWSRFFPNAFLHQLDESVVLLDPAWPVLPQPAHKDIHINPKFFDKPSIQTLPDKNVLEVSTDYSSDIEELPLSLPSTVVQTPQDKRILEVSSKCTPDIEELPLSVPSTVVQSPQRILEASTIADCSPDIEELPLSVSSTVVQSPKRILEASTDCTPDIEELPLSVASTVVQSPQRILVASTDCTPDIEELPLSVPSTVVQIPQIILGTSIESTSDIEELPLSTQSTVVQTLPDKRNLETSSECASVIELPLTLPSTSAQTQTDEIILEVSNKNIQEFNYSTRSRRMKNKRSFSECSSTDRVWLKQRKINEGSTSNLEVLEWVKNISEKLNNIDIVLPEVLKKLDTIISTLDRMAMNMGTSSNMIEVLAQVHQLNNKIQLIYSTRNVSPPNQ